MACWTSCYWLLTVASSWLISILFQFLEILGLFHSKTVVCTFCMLFLAFFQRKLHGKNVNVNFRTTLIDQPWFAVIKSWINATKLNLRLSSDEIALFIILIEFCCWLLLFLLTPLSVATRVASIVVPMLIVLLLITAAVVAVCIFVSYLDRNYGLWFGVWSAKMHSIW